MPAGTGLHAFSELDRRPRRSRRRRCRRSRWRPCTRRRVSSGVVFVVGLADGLLPIAYARTPEAVEEERRLLYVGVTRARRRLRLSWAERRGRGGAPPSRFLADLERRSRTGPSTARARVVRAG